MAYIRSDGTVAQGERPGATAVWKKANKGFWQLPAHWRAGIVAAAALVCRQWLSRNPLAGGKIPAAAVEPDKHWKRIKQDDLFVRTMTEPLGQKTFWQGRQRHMERDAEMSYNDPMYMKILMGEVDFGGPDGHVAEAGDWADLKYVQGTRCSTTRSALTAYFCGAAVAENQDVGLGDKRKGSSVGVESFWDFVACRHKQGEQTGSHRRSVYRLGIGCKDPLAGYSHAFSIIAQPDGTFFWLQSFIGEYSLPQWMSKTDLDGTPHAHLTLAQLKSKLKQVIRLTKISSWTPQANQDYLELFGVNKAIKKNRKTHQWNPSHRLQVFTWDEACEYPMPAPPVGESAEADEDSSQLPVFEWADECTLRNLLSHVQGTDYAPYLEARLDQVMKATKDETGAEDAEGDTNDSLPEEVDEIVEATMADGDAAIEIAEDSTTEFLSGEQAH